MGVALVLPWTADLARVLGRFPLFDARIAVNFHLLFNLLLALPFLFIVDRPRPSDPGSDIVANSLTDFAVKELKRGQMLSAEEIAAVTAMHAEILESQSIAIAVFLRGDAGDAGDAQRVMVDRTPPGHGRGHAPADDGKTAQVPLGPELAHREFRGRRPDFSGAHGSGDEVPNDRVRESQLCRARRRRSSIRQPKSPAPKRARVPGSGTAWTTLVSKL